ncbi:MAG: hypothetical protein AVDCRST_MAG73-3610 [uncultured Thermomicrobiales bacterium]|uniref:Uncharacterized protein n=1 Tax=uncultured Thermomicrobiales bacterium TaxID=1645740 RepID=A0A6J4UVC2_9BACT|nr:MAG: hypothetical protein AVDCRST_MAG73-3610 [uncultured Thermomicrobiales bacterium]
MSRGEPPLPDDAPPPGFDRASWSAAIHDGSVILRDPGKRRFPWLPRTIAGVWRLAWLTARSARYRLRSR